MEYESAFNKLAHAVACCIMGAEDKEDYTPGPNQIMFPGIRGQRELIEFIENLDLRDEIKQIIEDPELHAFFTEYDGGEL